MAGRLEYLQLVFFRSIRIDHIAICELVVQLYRAFDQGRKPRHRAFPVLEIYILDPCPLGRMRHHTAACYLLDRFYGPDMIRV
jgi:hypothetical protein